MIEKWTPERAKKESEEKILRALVLESPQRWSSILDKTKLSTKTLKKTLDRMRAAGLVYRQTKTSDEYPPPILYGLTPKGKNTVKPILFAMEAFQFLTGLEYSQYKIEEKDPTIILELEDVFRGREPKDVLMEIGRRVSALHLYTILLSLKEKNTEFADAVLTKGFDLRLYLALYRVVKGRVPTLHAAKTEVVNIGDEVFLRSKWHQVEALEKEQIASLQALLKQIYPKEVEALDKIMETIKAKN
jgi:DNA-binding HxlR family transcriptional regulator